MSFQTDFGRVVHEWQKSRLQRVQTVFDEYNLKGWNQQDTLQNMNNSINGEDDPNAEELPFPPKMVSELK